MNQLATALIAVTSVLLLGCDAKPEVTRPLDVTLLHVNDTLSHINEKRLTLDIQDESYRVMVGGAARAINAFEILESQNEHVLRFNTGNIITGNNYFTLFEGDADAAVSKLACFDAIGIGSHDFNAGERALKNFLDLLDRGPCVTDYVGSNIDFKPGSSPLARIKKDETIKEIAIKYIDNEPVGIISINPSLKTKMSSSPNESTKFDKEEKTAQKLINELHKSGINKIVVMSQLGIEKDIELAAKLKGVDVILGAGSHTLMGRVDFIEGASNYEYPLTRQDANGNTVCIAHAWNHYAVVGELQVSWNELGLVSKCAGTSHLLADVPYEVKDNTGEYVKPSSRQVALAMSVLQKSSPLIPVQRDEKADQVIGKFDAQVDRIQSKVIAEVTEDLCLERIPGEGRSKVCSVSTTSQSGSHITPVVAKAFLKAIRTSDAAIQNAGGVRTDIRKGPLTLGDAQNLLPFNNLIIELTMSGSEIKQVLEDAVDYSLSEGGTTGGFPYAAGLRWDLDMGRSINQRIQNLEINSQLENEWVPINDGKTYRIVTNNYIALGRDGYKTFGEVVKDGRYQDTFIYYTQAFVDYARNSKTLSRMSLDEMPIQDLSM
jgi:5'-nucleotidase